MSKRPDLRAMSEAVEAWYRFYEAPQNEQSSRVLCSAAVDLYKDGIRNGADRNVHRALVNQDKRPDVGLNALRARTRRASESACALMSMSAMESVPFRDVHTTQGLSGPVIGSVKMRGMCAIRQQLPPASSFVSKWVSLHPKERLSQASFIPRTHERREIGQAFIPEAEIGKGDAKRGKIQKSVLGDLLAGEPRQISGKVDVQRHLGFGPSISLSWSFSFSKSSSRSISGVWTTMRPCRIDVTSIC
ncbi:hypothetical protein [Rhizobium leguminosarum]|uniref:hypothetical protein n=1 Tax=Rhizobium leguminosarum TaxID=384 RepID=UPI0028AEE4F4|nr:hypothetical protein [Rhizobium leguminosarum]